MAARTWIAKLKALPRKSLPYVGELGLLALKNLGIPGGALLADVLAGIDKVKADKDLARMDQVLGVVLGQGRAILRSLEAHNVPPGQVSARLAKMAREQQLVQCTLDAMAEELREIPGMLDFLREDLRTLGEQLGQLAGKVDQIGAELRFSGKALAQGQADILAAMEDYFSRLLGPMQQPQADSGPRRLVGAIVSRLRAQPAAVGAGLHVELQVLSGPMQGKSFRFEEPDRFLFGRARDARCSIQNDGYVSKHHFLLDVHPPQVTLHDLQSKNGTFVNGLRYGGVKPPAAEVRVARHQASSVLLADGDEVSVGLTKLRVRLHMPPADLDAGTLSLPVQAESPAQPGAAPAIPAYSIERPLRRGSGVAHAFLARHAASGRLVVLKLILPELALDPRARARFERESALAGNLQHKGLVWFIERGLAGGTVYFVTEYVHGPDLEELRLEHGGRLPLAVALPLFRQLLDALVYLHGQGVVHRDLRPENVVIARQADGSQQAKIGDLGVARVADAGGITAMTRPGALRDAPFYWPREQITEYRDLAPAADVFAFAALCVRVLSGRYARASLQALAADADFHAVCAAIMCKPAVDVRHLIPELPEAWARVLQRALHDDPQQRFADALAMREALQGGLS